MNERGLPRTVESFILKNIHAVEQLEVLLLLRQAPDSDWTAEWISAAIRTNPVSVAARLRDLCARKLISKTCDGDQLAYRYSPSQDLKNVLDDLAKYYGTHRHVIIELVYSRPAEAIRTLADAFRIRREED